MAKTAISALNALKQKSDFHKALPEYHLEHLEQALAQALFRMDHGLPKCEEDLPTKPVTTTHQTVLHLKIGQTLTQCTVQFNKTPPLSGAAADTAFREFLKATQHGGETVSGYAPGETCLLRDALKHFEDETHISCTTADILLLDHVPSISNHSDTQEQKLLEIIHQYIDYYDTILDIQHTRQSIEITDIHLSPTIAGDGLWHE